MYHMAKRRIVACVLALVMLLSVLPVTAMAEAVEPVPAQQTEGETPAPAVPEEPKTEQPKTEEPKAEESKTEEPKTEEPKTEEPKTEEPKTEEPKAEESKAEQPKTGTPKALAPQLEAEGEDEAPVVMANGTYYWTIVNTSGGDVKLVISDSEYTLADGETLYTDTAINNGAEAKGTFDGTQPRGDTGFWGKYRFKITTVVVQGNVAPTNMSSWFYECNHLKSADLSALDTSKVTAMNSMFSECRVLTELMGISSWDVRQVQRMNSLFYRCYELTSLDISGWNTSSVTDMNGMFSQCTKLTGVKLGTGWNTSNVTSMSTMFVNCKELTGLDISNWNTSSVTNMRLMFENCKKLTSFDLSRWNLSSVTNFEQMFGQGSNISGIIAVDFTNVTVPEKNPTQTWRAVQMYGSAIAYVSDANNVKTKAGGVWLDDHEGFIAVTNGGKIPANTTFARLQLVAPEKEGYNFLGWYENPNFSGEPVTSPLPDGWRNAGKTYYAKWEPAKYTVTFNTDGGTPAPDAQTVQWNEKATKPATDPTKEDCRFLYWADKDGKEFDFDNTTITENITLTAKWETKQTVQLVIYRNGNTETAYKTVPLKKQFPGTVIDLTTLDIGDYYTANSTGKYDFYGWYDDGLLNIYKANVAKDEDAPAGMKTIKVNGWTNIICMVYDYQPVHVVIYRNGNTDKACSDTALAPVRKGNDIDLTKLNIGDYYTANYTGKFDFDGWYNDGGFNSYKKYLAGEQAKPAGMKTIKVNGWTNIIAMVYDYEPVVYFKTAEDLAAYQADHSKTEGLLFSTTARKGSALPTTDAPTATRDGYTFEYWSREGQNEDVTKSDNATVNGWTNLYAAWKANTDTPYKVEHYQEQLDGSYTVFETEEDLKGTTDTTATAAAKSYTGFTYDETVEGTVKSGTIAGNGSLVLKLYYTRNSYTVTFQPDNGDAATTAKVKYDGNVAKPATDPTKTGYTFVGWFADGANTAFEFDNTTITGDITLTAHWTINQYDVTFDPANGDKPTTEKVNYNEKAQKPADPTKSGYIFGGWYTDKKCTKGNEFSFDTKITGDITLYAKWDVKRTGTNPDAKNPYIKDNTKKDDGKTVKSGDTFDAGIGLYVGMSLLSLTGSALVVTRKKRG